MTLKHKKKHYAARRTNARRAYVKKAAGVAPMALRLPRQTSPAEKMAAEDVQQVAGSRAGSASRYGRYRRRQAAHDIEGLQEKMTKEKDRMERKKKNKLYAVAGMVQKEREER